MRRSRLPILLGACLSMASVTWADDLGYIDCTKHPENTQVQAKASRTQEIVTSLPCGERFTILATGYFFSRIETQDGKVGYVYSNLVSREDPDAAPRQSSAAKAKAAPPLAAARAFSAWAPRAAAAESKPAVATPRAPARAPNASTPATVVESQPGPAPSAPESTTPAPSANAAESKPAASTQPEPVPVQAAPAQAAAPAPAAEAPAAPVAESKPAPAQAPTATSNVPAPSATAAQPEPAAPAQPQPRPQPTPVQPSEEAPRAAAPRADFGRPIPRLSREPMAEFFGGYAFARLGGSGYGSNIHGALGSFGWNVRPWLQMVADTSYSVATVSGTKTVLYGNHFGPRVLFRPRNRLGATPFVEFLFGGSRVDTTPSGGSRVSVNGFSLKAGGGLDWKLSPHVTVRLFDADYYRTPFLTGAQNNYWVSSGIVLRLFGGGAQ